jgi:hypothetical protein
MIIRIWDFNLNLGGGRAEQQAEQSEERYIGGGRAEKQTEGFFSFFLKSLLPFQVLLSPFIWEFF